MQEKDSWDLGQGIAGWMQYDTNPMKWRSLLILLVRGMQMEAFLVGAIQKSK